MGRKTKYSAPSDQRTEIRLTAVQKETLYKTQVICKANDLPHSKHDVMIAGLNMYYDYLMKTISRKQHETHSEHNNSNYPNCSGLFDVVSS